MTVNEIPVNIRCIEYRQTREDSNYGSCLHARFYFNLNKYELMIISDCGNYSYKWTETLDSESFLELMARINGDYLINKLCGEPQTFDYEATKKHMYDYWGEDELDKAILDRIFKELEYEDRSQFSSDIFLMKFDEYNYDTNPCHAYFSDVWEMVQYSYTPWQERICKIFVDVIQPKIREILKSDSK